MHYQIIELIGPFLFPRYYLAYALVCKRWRDYLGKEKYVKMTRIAQSESTPYLIWSIPYARRSYKVAVLEKAARQENWDLIGAFPTLFHPLTRKLASGTLRKAIAQGHTSAVMYLERCCTEWTSKATRVAAKSKRRELLHWACLDDRPFHEAVVDFAVKERDPVLLEWCFKNEAAQQVGTAAAGEGNLSLIQEAMTRGCVLDERILCAASQHGDFCSFEYVYSEGRYHDLPGARHRCLKEAICNGNLSIVQYLTERGASLNEKDLTFHLSFSGAAKVAAWFLERGFEPIGFWGECVLENVAKHAPNV